MSTQEQDFQWTDKLVIEFAVNWMKERVDFAITNDLAAAPLPIQLSVERFKDEKVEKHSPEYEILSFIGTGQANRGDIFSINEDGTYSVPVWRRSGLDGLRLEHFFEGENVTAIHSVRRLSDGEVFSVGDTVYHVDGLYPVTIIEFYLPPSERGEMWFYWSSFKETVKNLDNFKKQDSLISPPKKPLFTTEDGVDIYEENVVLYGVSAKGLWAKGERHFSQIQLSESMKWFANEYNRDRYILENKPVLSVRDVWSLTAKYGYDMMALENDVINLAKEKL